VQNKTPSLGETRTHTRNNALISHDRWFPDRTVRWSGRTARRGMQAQRPKPRAGVGSHASLASAIKRVAVHIATHILAFEGESKVTFFDGNFSKYDEWRKQTLGDAATRPHGITYRKLTR
jgi:hypothetical protein